MEKTENRERKGNKNLLFIIVGVILLVGGIIFAVNVSKGPSCAENEEFKDGLCVLKREVDTYTFERDYEDKGKHMKITIEVPKSLGYERKDSDIRIELYRESDRSTVSIYQMITSKNSIAMKESDYSKTAWKDYKSTDNEDGTKTVVINKIRTDGSISGVEWSKTMTQVKDATWSGVRVTAMASGLDQGEDSSFGGKDYKTFKARETYESEDFQYMLSSIKVELTDLSTPDAD